MICGPMHGSDFCRRRGGKYTIAKCYTVLFYH